jgi:hypothetical protein
VVDADHYAHEQHQADQQREVKIAKDLCHFDFPQRAISSQVAAPGGSEIAVIKRVRCTTLT